MTSDLGKRTTPLGRTFKLYRRLNAMRASLSRPDLFDAHLKRSPNGCWEWQGCVGRFGHGQLNIGGRTVMAHRHAWRLRHGQIPIGLCVLHRCDNPPCCNPDHLFLGTRADNVADMDAKGRRGSSHGESNARSTIPDWLVDAVVRRYRRGGTTLKEIADDLAEQGMPVHFATISKWVKGTTRQPVP